MNIKDISTLVQQKTIPASIQEDVLTRAKKLISDGYEVEAIASITSVTLDVYNEQGERVDRIKRTFSTKKWNVNKESELENIEDLD